MKNAAVEAVTWAGAGVLALLIVLIPIAINLGLLYGACLIVKSVFGL